jgi:hypothetical protein
VLVRQNQTCAYLSQGFAAPVTIRLTLEFSLNYSKLLIASAGQVALMIPNKWAYLVELRSSRPCLNDALGRFLRWPSLTGRKIETALGSMPPRLNAGGSMASGQEVDV